MTDIRAFYNIFPNLHDFSSVSFRSSEFKDRYFTRIENSNLFFTHFIVCWNMIQRFVSLLSCVISLKNVNVLASHCKNHKNESVQSMALRFTLKKQTFCLPAPSFKRDFKSKH